MEYPPFRNYMNTTININMFFFAWGEKTYVTGAIE